MIRTLFILLMFGTYQSIQAQSIQDPIAHTSQIRRATGFNVNGRTSLKWIVDMNHDGIDDILVSLKPTSSEDKERQEEERNTFTESYYAFNVYIGLKNGAYIYRNYVEEASGNVEGGVGIDISQCFVGYIDEVKQYGIVTVEEREVAPVGGHGLPVPKKQIYCYTVSSDHIKRTDLTPLIDLDEKNRVFDKYLSESKRTHVVMQEVGSP